MDPSYQDLAEMLAKIVNRASRPIGEDSCGRPMVKLPEALIQEARELMERNVRCSNVLHGR